MLASLQLNYGLPLNYSEFELIYGKVDNGQFSFSWLIVEKDCRSVGQHFGPSTADAVTGASHSPVEDGLHVEPVQNCDTESHSGLAT
jgi:hypothetical protein